MFLLHSSNILLGKDFNAKLGDFGLIRVQSIEEDGRDTNETQDVQGTTLYMPPEAMNGKVSTKWDIYSFGVVGTPVYGSLFVIFNNNRCKYF